jgi:hypothetical protein
MILVIMHHLPDETIMNILGFVPDKIYVSMVCKKWVKLLDDMYKQNLISNFNDPYYLCKIYYKKSIDDHIENITNHKCLNYIYHMGTDALVYYRVKLLMQNCRVNNISKPENINKLYNNAYYSVTNAYMFGSIFKNKSYDMLLLISFEKCPDDYWLDYYKTETDIDVLIDEMKTLHDMQIITFTTFYERIYKDNNFKLKTQALEFLGQYVNIKMRTLIHNYHKNSHF